MIFPLKSNMYEYNATTTLAQYGDFIDGDANTTFIAVSTHEFSPAARQALENSAESLGYGSHTCAYVVVHPTQQTGVPLENTCADNLLSIIEGLDPIALVVADEQAAEDVANAYHAQLTCDAFTRLFGRDVVVFRNFEGMLDDSANKQRAWALLKKLTLREN